MHPEREVELRGVDASAAGIVASVTPAGGGVQTLTLLVLTLSPARRVQITAAANESGRTFTITGRDRYGNTKTETLAGPNVSTTLSTWEYSTLTSITVDDDTTGAITVGWDNVFYSQWIPVRDWNTTMNVGIGVIALGTVNYTVQHCYQSYLMKDGALGHNDTNAMIFDHQSLVSQSGNSEGGYDLPVTAVRLKLNSCNDGDGALMRVNQTWG